ncbi:MAG: response regulator [Candidatus Omnitrophota bacterium]
MAKQKILVVDDEYQLVDMVQMRLEANNYEVITAYDGKEGLEKARKEKPGLILLDILMPEMDGYQALEKLREDITTKLIPVIMFTAKGQLEDISKAAGLGIEDYIVKPFDYRVMLEKIKKALS